MDTDIYVSVSDDQGATWSPRSRVAESLGGVDRFNHWLATDPVTGLVNVSFYDTRNDSTGVRAATASRASCRASRRAGSRACGVPALARRAELFALADRG